ncbi:MAG: hypothetical protein KAY50_08235 [Chitinophagaceae bacterium]|nr:hypothetical protein [Chitinophagaceae bacterium]
MNKIYAFFLRNLTLFGILISLVVCSLCGWYFYKHWYEDANCYSDNIKIEIFCGIIIASIPTIVGYYFGKKFSNDILLLNIRGLLKKIQKRRMRGDFTTDTEKASDTARGLVIDISNELAREMSSNNLLNKISEKVMMRATSKDPCNVCGKKFDFSIIDKKPKCDHCKLNSLAWDIEKEKD